MGIGSKQTVGVERGQNSRIEIHCLHKDQIDLKYMQYKKS